MDPIGMTPAMELALRASFGGLPGWREAVLALDRAQPGGAAWLHLAFRPDDAALVNRLAADEAPAGDGSVTLLALRRPVEAALDSVDWGGVYARYQQAVDAASTGCGATQDEAASALLLDVRRAGVFEQAPALIPGARWCDPGTVSNWAASVPKDREVVVYCVYGHEVGRSTALRLRAAGVRARYLEGGIDAWQKAGRPLQPKPDRT